MIKKTIAVILLVCMSVGACACSSQFGIYNLFKNADTLSKTQKPQYDTAYPDDVAVTFGNAITVEKATEDLFQNMYHECLKNGTVTFDKLTSSSLDLDSTEAIFWFDISVQHEYGNENYRAKVIYTDIPNSNGRREYKYSKFSDIWQVTSTFTQLGKWTYDDGENHILVNFIRTDEPGYVVEYEISYYASFWIGGRRIETVSNGEVTVYGDSQWDGNNEYLSIDLGDFYNENEQKIDLGYVKVYPWNGVYWDALHAEGGPFRLTKG